MNSRVEIAFGLQGFNRFQRRMYFFVYFFTVQFRIIALAHKNVRNGKSTSRTRANFGLFPENTFTNEQFYFYFLPLAYRLVNCHRRSTGRDDCGR